MKKIIVAIDGPSGSGKSTVAKLLAKKLGYTYIDTGAMYRALALQRRMGENGGVVLEGRDVGTVIFPNAEAKFFLDASLEERGKRRYKELAAKGLDVTLEQTIEDVKKRDINDSSRDVAPLKIAADSILIDSTNVGIEEVVEQMIEVIKSREA